MIVKMSFSQISVEESIKIKKRLYIGGAADEYSCSSQPLSSIVLTTVLSVMSVKHSQRSLKLGYMANLTREGGISPCSMMLGLFYIKRLSQLNPSFFSTLSSRELFLVSMVIASKYLNDEGEMEGLTNSEFAAIGYTPKARLDQLEMNFLHAIDWKLFVSLKEYYGFVTSMEGRVALSEASQRGWFTYSDICAVWEVTDLQANMLTASKQTAKVACGSALLYLVCVATLFASTPQTPSSNIITSITSPAQNESSSLSDLCLDQSTFKPSHFKEGQSEPLTVMQLKRLSKYDVGIGNCISNRLLVVDHTPSSLLTDGLGSPLTPVDGCDLEETKFSPLKTPIYGNKERKKVSPPSSKQTNYNIAPLSGSNLFLFLNLTAALTSPDLLSATPLSAVKTCSSLNPVTSLLIHPDMSTRNEWVNDVRTEWINDMNSSGSRPMLPVRDSNCKYKNAINDSAVDNPPSGSDTPHSIYSSQSSSFDLPRLHETVFKGDPTSLDPSTAVSSSQLCNAIKETRNIETTNSNSNFYEQSSMASPSSSYWFKDPLTTPTMALTSNIVTSMVTLTTGVPPVENNFTLLEAFRLFAMSVLVS